MSKQLVFFQKGSGIAPYIWILFSILPFYFIFQSSSQIEVIIGITLTIMFFLLFRFAFISKKWPVYVWTSFLIVISITMTIVFQYVYFAFYIAYYIGNIKNRAGFLTLYIVHLTLTTISININFIFQAEEYVKQLPFVVIIWISVILLPFNIYNKKKQDRLEQQLAVANDRIADLVKQEERQRIARDLHDVLGQKLSLIGLKSDLARKLIYKDPEQVKTELKDVQQTARTALNEVRKLVSQMRGIRLKDELVHVNQILKAAEINFVYKEEGPLNNISLFLENILSMCLKEVVTNIVKHSKAKNCTLSIKQSPSEIVITVKDDGIGLNIEKDYGKGNGLLGINERLEFVNGTLEITNNNGTTIYMKIPHALKQFHKEDQ
jgi:two-component system, NarL family, sensor histidine kinase DesK